MQKQLTDDEIKQVSGGAQSLLGISIYHYGDGSTEVRWGDQGQYRMNSSKGYYEKPGTPA
jgi:hypothetical protein